MPNYVYPFIALTGGGTGALDAIDGTALTDQDMAYGTVAGVTYNYILDADSGLTESSPKVIQPDANGGTKRWILTNVSGINAPLANLLPNTEWKAMSGSTLENMGSQLIASWANSDYDTFASTAENITSAIYSTAGTQNADTASIVITSGKLYKIVATLTLNSGQVPTLTGTGGVTTTTLSAGANTIVFEATAAATILTMTNTSASNYSCTFTLYEVTPGYVAADTLAPDGGTKTTTLDIHRIQLDTTHVKGYYGLKYTKGAATAEYHNFLSITNRADLDKYKGRVVTFGMEGYSTTATDNLKIQIYDGVGTTESAFWGADALSWKEITRTVDTSATELTFRVLLDGAASDVAYGSFVMAIDGSSIGTDNYAPKLSEVIWLQTYIRVENGTQPASGATAKNLEVWSNGAVGKGIKAIHVQVQGSNTAAGEMFQILPTITSAFGVKMGSQVANVVNYTQGWLPTDSNGDCSIASSDGDWSSIFLDIYGIQP